MKKTLSTLALSLFALVGVAQAADITVENAAGKQVVPQNPQRVIVLDFGAADTLRALGVQDKIVGFPQSGKIPNYLSEFADKKYKNVGDLKEQSLEQINELNPDLIIASKRQEKMIDKFKEIAPVFNVENYIERCVKSIISQTLKTIEIIFLDDGSTDNSLNILRDYEKKDERIQIFDCGEIGVSKCRNKGIELSSGKYIMFVDSDDWIDSNMVEVMYKKAEENKLDLVMCSYIREFKDHSKEKIFNLPQ